MTVYMYVRVFVCGCVNNSNTLHTFHFPIDGAVIVFTFSNTYAQAIVTYH